MSEIPADMLEEGAATTVNGLHVNVYQTPTEKAYRVRPVEHTNLEMTVYQEYGDGRWYGPNIAIYMVDDEKEGPLPEQHKIDGIVLLGRCATLFVDMAANPDEDVSIGRYHRIHR